jgi:hypothetical protein
VIPAQQKERGIVYAGSADNFLAQDDPTATQDPAVGLQVGTYGATITSKAWTITPLHHYKRLGQSYLMAKVAAGPPTIRQELIRNFDDETRRTSDVTLAGAGSESRVFKKFEDAGLVDAWTFQVKLGDATEVAAAPWQLDKWVATYEVTDQER